MQWYHISDITIPDALCISFRQSASFSLHKGTVLFTIPYHRNRRSWAT